MKKREIYIWSIVIIMFCTQLIHAQTTTHLPYIRVGEHSIGLGIDPNGKDLSTNFSSLSWVTNLILCMEPPYYRSPKVEAIQAILQSRTSDMDKRIQALGWAILFQQQIVLDSALVAYHLQDMSNKGTAHQQKQIAVLQNLWDKKTKE